MLFRSSRYVSKATHRARLFAYRFGEIKAFRPISTAPTDKALRVKVRDQSRAEYALPFAVELRDDGRWINAELGTQLGRGLEVIGWRKWTGERS